MWQEYLSQRCISLFNRLGSTKAWTATLLLLPLHDMSVASSETPQVLWSRTHWGWCPSYYRGSFSSEMSCMPATKWEYARGMAGGLHRRAVSSSPFNRPSWCTILPRYLHQPIVAVDANFYLKNLHKSMQEHDPRLHTGNAYMVEHEEYIKHVQCYAS